MKTTRLYWSSDEVLETEARVVGRQGTEIALDQTCFYPGGGGQPCDVGTLDGLPVVQVRADTDGMVWHQVEGNPPEAGATVHLAVDRPRREALARYHTVLHILNTIVLRDYSGWITGAQIGVDYSRIDFNLNLALTPEFRSELERKVNAVIQQDHPIHAYWLTETEFQQRPDLLRTLDVKPPVNDGRVRVVEIQGFDAQACGGTHLSSSAGLGRFAITKTENKGKQNKRLYVHLALPPG